MKLVACGRFDPYAIDLNIIRHMTAQCDLVTGWFTLAFLSEVFVKDINCIMPLISHYFDCTLVEKPNIFLFSKNMTSKFYIERFSANFVRCYCRANYVNVTWEFN